MMSLDLDSKHRLKMTTLDIPSFTSEKIHHRKVVLMMSLDLDSKHRLKMTTVDILSFTSEKLHHS